MHSEKQKGAEGGNVFKPKIILNFQYRLLEKKKKLKANRIADFFFYCAPMVLSPLPSEKNQPNPQNDHFSWPNFPIFVIYNWKQTAFSWLQGTGSSGS